MGAITTNAAETFRDYATAGVPASGDWEPLKSDIRSDFAEIDLAISAITLAGGIAVAKATKANLDADLAYIAGKIALVYGDGTPANNGYYVKSGGSGAGSWAIVPTLSIPSTFAADLATVLAAVEDLEAYVASLVEDKVDEVVQPLVDAAAASAAAAAASQAVILAQTGEMEVTSNSELAWAFADEDGNIGLGQLLDGTLIGLDLSGSAASAYPTPTVGAAPVGTVNGVFGYGQSLSNGYGNGGIPILSTTQPFNNLMFAGGVADATVGYANFAPLVAVTSGNHGETIGNGLADSVASRLAPAKYPILVNSEGQDATAIAGLVKGQSPFTALLASVTAAKAEADSLNDVFFAQALFFIQGESDEQADTAKATYKTAKLSIFTDFITDAKAAASQAHDPVVFFDQTASWTTYSNTTPTVAIADYEIARDTPQHILVCPKYFLNYVDGAHLTAHSYRWLGEYYAKAYLQTVVVGVDFKPLIPLSVKKYGPRAIVAKFNVPVGPLVLDDENVTDPNGKYGFEVVDSGGAKTITAVELIGPDSVKLTLSADLTTLPKLRYAFTGTSGALPGPTTGARGCLRDSDPAVSYYTDSNGAPYPLWNWCVTFEEAIV